ncbi:MAG TPA: glycerate kinase [Bacilli bacterium]|nr:glycerate kinase [Bacilli bacterium]HQC74823.1 glycerate kinase [Bacilli bacterium]
MAKKIIVIPDSFKACLSSYEVANIIKDALKAVIPDAEVITIPVSDGGEGLVDSYLTAVGGQKIALSTSGPYQERIDSFYGMINPQTAIIEMAASAGLTLVKDRPNPSLTTTYGVGELIIDAMNKGASTIILGLGGSATNDMGVGMAHCLGVQFFNRNHDLFLPVGGTLKEIKTINIDKLHPLIKKTKFIALCDVKNPLYGPQGAAFVYAKQKGANDAMILELDENMRQLALVLQKQFGMEVDFAGAGAAGGMTVSAKLFLHAEIKSGIETFLKMIKFQDLIKKADLIISGEGKFDSQSLSGKVIGGIAAEAAFAQVPLYALVGQKADMDEANYPQALKKVISLMEYSHSLADSFLNARFYLSKATKELAKSLFK